MIFLKLLETISYREKLFYKIKKLTLKIKYCLITFRFYRKTKFSVNRINLNPLTSTFGKAAPKFPANASEEEGFEETLSTCQLVRVTKKAIHLQKKIF